MDKRVYQPELVDTKMTDLAPLPRRPPVANQRPTVRGRVDIGQDGLTTGRFAEPVRCLDLIDNSVNPPQPTRRTPESSELTPPNPGQTRASTKPGVPQLATGRRTGSQGIPDAEP